MAILGGGAGGVQPGQCFSTWSVLVLRLSLEGVKNGNCENGVGVVDLRGKGKGG